MARRQGGTLGTFTPLSTPNAPTDLSVSTSIGSATVSFTAPTDTGDGAVTSYIVTAIDESTGASTGATGSSSPINLSLSSGTFKVRAQAVNGFGPGRLTEFVTGVAPLSGAELYAWGFNNAGQIGDNTVDKRSSPVQIGALTTWSTVSAGDTHSAAIKTDGTLWTWGQNISGRLGDGTVVAKSSPVQIGALTNWSQVSAGTSTTSAVKTDGTLWGWGNNAYVGAIGDSTLISRSSPVQIGALTTWVQVASGDLVTAAIKTDGTLWTWGDNSNGELGDGTTASKSSPVQVGALTNWSQVSAGRQRMAATTTSGELYMWGSNYFGALGDNTTISKSSPVQIGALTNWSVASANRGGGAIKTDGTLWLWGRNSYGQIGDNTTTDRSSPVQIGTLAWSRFSSASYQPHAIRSDGTLWGWGLNNNGGVGDNTTIRRSSPVQIGASTDWLEVSDTGGHALAILGVV